MRSTILFLALLVFVSCTTEMTESYDSVLLEMATDPRSEAVFATMNVQLKQEGGFDRVLALLNQLVDDGRKQLHVANKIWRKTEARCDVATMKFAERQNYYETKESTLNQLISEMYKEKNDAASSAASMKVYNAWFEGFNRRNVLRKAESAAQLNKRYTVAQDAVAATKRAIETVSNWTVRGQPVARSKPVAAARVALRDDKSKSRHPNRSFIQENLEEVTSAFLELKGFELVIPESFVELAADNHKVRRRLLEWLGQLRVTFVEIADHFQQKAAARSEIFGRQIAAVSALLAKYALDATHAKHAVARFSTHLSSAKEAIEFVAKLSKQNAKLVIANTDYCRVEKHNYSNTKNLIDGQLVLFGKIKRYFIDNYKKISKFIKKKYHRTN